MWGGDGGEFPRTQSEAGQSSGDFLAKNLARQLDLTQGGGGDIVLPTIHNGSTSSSNRVFQLKPDYRAFGTPKKQKKCSCKLSRCLRKYCECFNSGTYCDGCNCANCYNTVENEAARKPDSPKSRARPAKKHQCNCKHSRCLKLYCECFASGTYCDGCNCANCYNNVENEAVIREAVEATLERNPRAFRPKVVEIPMEVVDENMV